MTDKRDQGQRPGKHTIDAVMDLICTYPFGKVKTWLSHDPKSTRAGVIYRKHGVAKSEETCGSETVAVYE